MSSLLLLIALTGGRVGPGMVNLVIAQRKAAWKKWRDFVDFVAALLVQGIFYLRGVQTFTNPAGEPVYSFEALSKGATQNQKDNLLKDFLFHSVDKVVKLLFTLLEPDETEMMLMTQLMNTAGMGMGGNTTVINQPAAAPTARAVRTSGGRAQGVMVYDNGTVYLD